jgi:hypothetical protein
MADATDPVAAYEAAVAAFHRADLHAKALIHHVTAGYSCLSGTRWQTTPVVGCPGPLGASGSIAFDPNTWPYGTELKDAILQWRQTKDPRSKAWLAIPDDRKRGLEPPPE